ncbi:MAG: tRNA (adenosine(37)-N6)-threonylcarbamoyltransferase complex dimerization subunit type 1 TsaB [Deltaproteobacteria bacterium RIFCSPHIGHO2_12_FULL_43_9]|nr:MAG: tRNA (adenosine(37)-N6)-threonylcarbamoyltransferase complex dimerization subunit type 1 TsaB [Deltaproteobacteria bacterium RIFCSPHIGHO2_12_FULL_43_9]
MSTILAIETATPHGSVALLYNNKLICELFTDNTQTHAATLLPTIEQLCSITQTDIQSVDGIAVSIGPGAFTGLRVGISTAQGLAQTLKLPIFPIPTLEAFAHSITQTKTPIFITLDARKDEIYGALFRWTDKELVRLIPESALTPEGWSGLLSQTIQKPFTVIGSGYKKYEEFFRETFRERITGISNHNAIPRALNVGLLASGRGKRPEEIKPIYLRYC